MPLNIDRVLKAKGLNKAKLAELMGKGDNRSYVTNLLRSPTLSSLEKIAEALDVPVVELFDDIREKNPVAITTIGGELKTFYNIFELKEYINNL